MSRQRFALALEAVAALSAWETGIDRDPIARAHVRHLGADLHDLASRLVAEDHRLLDAHRAKAAMQVVVQVGPADAAGADADFHVTAAHGSNVRLLDPEVAGGVDDGGLHGRSPSVKHRVDILRLNRPRASPSCSRTAWGRCPAPARRTCCR